MKIDIYTVVWNESFIMPYFMRHYSTFARKIYVINHKCTDSTIERAKGAEILDYPFMEFNEANHSRAFEMAYQMFSKDADYVMCVDADEFILNEKLDSRHPLVKVTSYMMISEQPPVTDGQIYDEVKRGVRMRSFDKPIIFNPGLNVKFGDGRHSVEANAEPVTTGTRMLHYKYLGRDYYYNRAKEVYPRKPRPKGEIEYRLKKGLKWYDDHIKTAENVVE